ncbi:MAG: hypothetical protein WBA13_23245 [Microcoleaceae cyanobacterium]
MTHKSIKCATDSAWETYKRLEGLPTDLPQPPSPHVTLGTQYLWRKLLDLLADELVYDQQVEFLERCWLQDYSFCQKPVSLQQLWTLMN